MARLERVQKDEKASLQDKLGARLFGGVREKDLEQTNERISKLRNEKHALEAKLGEQRKETTALLAQVSQMENKTKELQEKERELQEAHDEEEKIIRKLDEEKQYHEQLVQEVNALEAEKTAQVKR